MFIIPNKMTQRTYNNNKQSIHAVRMHEENEYSDFYTTKSLVKYAENALYEMRRYNYWNDERYDCDFEILDLYDVLKVMDEYGYQVLLDYNNSLSDKTSLISSDYSDIVNKLNEEVIDYIWANPIEYFDPED